MSNLETTTNCVGHLLVIGPELLNGVVGRDDQSTVLKINLPSFCLSCTCIPVCPDLEVMSEAGTTTIQIVEDDALLVGIPVEPLVLRLDVRLRVILSSLTALTRAGLSDEPLSSNIGVRVGRLK